MALPGGTSSYEGQPVKAIAVFGHQPDLVEAIEEHAQAARATTIILSRPAQRKLLVDGAWVEQAYCYAAFVP